MVNREKGKLSIRDVLKERDETFYSKTVTLWDRAHELQERQKSKEGHQQGTLHCLEVEKNLGKLISDEDKRNRFTPLELFLLSVAACYHDAGKSGDFDEKHALVVANDIFSNPEKYNVTDPEGKVLYYIIGSHDDDDVFYNTREIFPIGSEDVHVKILSTLFRLADVLHTDHSRIPHIRVADDDSTEDDKTRFRKLVKGWGFEGDSKITLTAIPENMSDYNLIAKGVSMLQEQIDCIVPVLRLENCPYELICSCDNKAVQSEVERENRSKILWMDYYTENDADIFKGRDKESEKLQKNVISQKRPISLLIGNSGVGKTSLIRAGLFPRLNMMGWGCVWTRPLNPDPIKHILNDINTKLPHGYGSDNIISSIEKLSDECKSDVIIAIDQFEDILRSPAPAKETIGNILLRIHGKSFKNIHIILSYRGDYEPEIKLFLNESGVTRLDSVPLIGIEMSEVNGVLRNIFEVNHVGISDELLDRIVQELEKESEDGKFYPPFIQIVSSSLIDLAKSNKGVITEELYNNQAISVGKIIGTYLIKRLDEFGAINSVKRRNVEEILKELVRDGAKDQKGKNDLERYLDISGNELQGLLDELVDKRLVRHLDNDRYEIIHDYLASRVEDLIIKDADHLIRNARYVLQTAVEHYRNMPTLAYLLQPGPMCHLYSMRESIKPDTREKNLLMVSYLAGNGPVWWWFRDIEETSYRTMIIEAMSNKIPAMRRGAIRVFTKLGTREDIEVIKDKLDDPNRDVRKAAIEAFAKLGIHNDLEVIKDKLDDRSWRVRVAAIGAFGKLGIHNDLEVMKDKLDDREWSVRIAVIEAFGKLGTHDDLEVIKDKLNDLNREVRMAAIGAFAKLGTHDDLEVMKDKLDDTSWSVRIAVIEALGKLGTHDDLEVMKDVLNDPNRDVRKAAIEAFGKLGTHDDLEVMKDKLDDTHWSVRMRAVEALGKLGTHDDLEVIKDKLNDTGWSVRTMAVEALGKLGTHDDLEVIKDKLNDTGWSVRTMAVEALGKLGTRGDLEVIKDMLDDPNPVVRTAASNYISEFGNENDLGGIVTMYANGEVVNPESLKCIITLDEKFYSTFKKPTRESGNA